MIVTRAMQPDKSRSRSASISLIKSSNYRLLYYSENYAFRLVHVLVVSLSRDQLSEHARYHVRCVLLGPVDGPIGLVQKEFAYQLYIQFQKNVASVTTAANFYL